MEMPAAEAAMAGGNSWGSSSGRILHCLGRDLPESKACPRAALRHWRHTCADAWDGEFNGLVEPRGCRLEGPTDNSPHEAPCSPIERLNMLLDSSYWLQVARMSAGQDSTFASGALYETRMRLSSGWSSAREYHAREQDGFKRRLIECGVPPRRLSTLRQGCQRTPWCTPSPSKLYGSVYRWSAELCALWMVLGQQA